MPTCARQTLSELLSRMPPASGTVRHPRSDAALCCAGLRAGKTNEVPNKARPWPGIKRLGAPGRVRPPPGRTPFFRRKTRHVGVLCTINQEAQSLLASTRGRTLPFVAPVSTANKEGTLLRLRKGTFGTRAAAPAKARPCDGQMSWPAVSQRRLVLPETLWPHSRQFRRPPAAHATIPQRHRRPARPGPARPGQDCPERRNPCRDPRAH